MKQEKTSTRPSARWHASARPSTMLTAAVIAMTVLCFTACASSRKSVSRETATSQEANRLDVDSTVSVVETWRTPVKVPMSAVSLTLSMEFAKSGMPAFADNSAAAAVRSGLHSPERTGECEGNAEGTDGEGTGAAGD